LASVAEKLLEIYAEDGMTLEQLMAFTVTADQARQERVWEALQQSYHKEPTRSGASPKGPTKRVGPSFLGAPSIWRRLMASKCEEEGGRDGFEPMGP